MRFSTCRGRRAPRPFGDEQLDDQAHELDPAVA